jgi:D-alanyl-D-alanine carboxypeptidase
MAYDKLNRALLLLVIVGSAGLAQACYASADQFLDGQIKLLEHKIVSWEWKSEIVGTLIFAVFVIGLAVAALQTSASRTFKIVAAALSFISAVIVGFYHQVFPADDRAYGKTARLARSKLNAFTYELEQYSPPIDKDTMTALHKKFADLISDVEQIENTKIYGAGATEGAPVPKPAAGVILISSVNAEPTATATAQAAPTPAWAEKAPEDDKYFYFVGKGTGSSFGQARQNAVNDAQRLASSRFTRSLKISAELANKSELINQLVSALGASTEVADTFVAPDPSSGYHGFALWDIGVFDNGQYLDESPLYGQVGGIGKGLGLEWGGDWSSFTDEPHFQIVPEAQLSDIAAKFQQGITFV